MTSQGSFFEEIDRPETQLRRNPRPTEISGAVTGLPKSGSHRRIAYDYIRQRGLDGATSDEISIYMDALGMYVPPNQVASRVGELVRDRFIQNSGTTRKTRRNAEAIVWIVWIKQGEHK